MQFKIFLKKKKCLVNTELVIIQKLPFKARFVVRPGTHGHAEVAI